MSFFERLPYFASETENRLKEILQKRSHLGAKRLNDAIEYSLLNGGKRLRGYLVLEFCNLCGCGHEKALDYAAAMEMIQAFSLIHDDLPSMDNDDMRRGKPSCHKAFDEATAILAGDSLALDAFLTVAGNERCDSKQNIEAVSVLSEKSGSLGMCAGQQFDLMGENQTLAIEELARLVDLKTCALFSGSCILGCIAADADNRLKEAAETFGLMTGRAFQITDDLLDIRSSAEVLGKTVGKDEKQGKSTFAALLGVNGAENMAKDCIEKAKAALCSFPDNQSKAALTEFCDYILIRKN